MKITQMLCQEFSIQTGENEEYNLIYTVHN